MTRALIVALILVFAAGGIPAYATLATVAPASSRQAAPAAAFLLVQAAAKPVTAKRCGSRGGVRRQRNYYGGNYC